MTALLNQIAALAGPLRARTFSEASRLLLEGQPPGGIVETGCYRGIEADGQSTVICGLLAQALGRVAESCDLNAQHGDMARGKLQSAGLSDKVRVTRADSVEWLSRYPFPIALLYLDSLDFDGGNPGPSQRHQLAELGAAYGKLTPESIVLLDDCDLPHGGKAGLTSLFLEERGWRPCLRTYQSLWLRHK